MKKIIISFILNSFIVFAFSQDLKVLDLSKGGVRITDITVEKIKANQFVIICDSSLSISQVILNAGQSDSMKVKDTAVPNILYKEKTSNHTDLQLSQDKKDTLKLFVFESSHNYQIEHNNKTWDIIVRKRKGKRTDLFLEDSILHIGDTCIAIRDTMHIALIDSLILSKWDRKLSLSKNGAQLKDSLCIAVDDSCCYYFKTILSSDSTIHANDTLSIKLSNNRNYVVVFEKTDAPQSTYWWLLLLLLIIPALCVIKIGYFPWRKRHQNSNHQDSNQVPNKEISDKNGPPNAKSESDGFVDILSKIESLKFEGDDTRTEGLYPSTIEEIKSYIEEVVDEVKAIEVSKKDAAINEAVQKEKDSLDEKIKRIEKEKQEAVEEAEAIEKSKKEAIADAVRGAKDSYEKEKKGLREDKEEAENKLKNTQKELKETREKLEKTETDRDNKIIKIRQLEEAQKQFTSSLSMVPFAETYSKQIHELLKLGSEIQTTAYSMLDSNVEDPYFIMKAISKYGKMINGIDMENFLMDVNMVSKAKLVFNGSSLATFKEDNKDIDSDVRKYFFNNYLEKYINALMVLNESMSGLKILLPEVQSKVTIFDEYRDKISSFAEKLKVSVIYVKVGEMAGENIDLKAKTVNVEIGESGQILEIENCIVYQKDNRKPQTKIKVTIKK